VKYTIGITTFEHRFEKYFKPLIKQIKSTRPDLEVIVYINAQYGTGLDETYRKNILQFISEYDNICPLMTPHFKGLSKMWNNIIIHSSNNNVFVMNDDISLEPTFFTQVDEVFKQTKSSFRINSSFSHFHVNREEVFEVGFFDERLIGLGEEDGDWCFRWERHYQKNLPSLNTPFVKSFYYVKDENNSEGMEKDTAHSKYTPWNARWIFKNKYDPENTELALKQGFPADGRGGMYGKPVAIREDSIELDFYPAEKFFWEHIDELKELKK
jgi:hypothetical protein